MDPSELIPILVACLVAVLAIAACLRMRRVSSKGVRFALVGMTGCVAVLAVVVAGALTFFYVNYTKHRGPLGSPDHRHVAITTYTVNNGTGVDEVEIAVRHTWSPYAHRIFTGQAQYQAGSTTQGPALRWIDDTRLEVDFQTYVTDEATGRGKGEAGTGCASFADGITITCIETRVHAVR